MSVDPRAMISGSSRRSGARRVEDVKRPASGTNVTGFREENGTSHQGQPRHRRAPGPGVEASVQVSGRYHRRGRLSRAKRPGTGPRGYRRGNLTRFSRETADRAFGQRSDPPRIGSGRDQVRAPALGATRRKQGQSQEQYDSSCLRKDQWIDSGELFHSCGLAEQGPSSSRGKAPNQETCDDPRSKRDSRLQRTRINCKSLVIFRFMPEVFIAGGQAVEQLRQRHRDVFHRYL